MQSNNYYATNQPGAYTYQKIINFFRLFFDTQNVLKDCNHKIILQFQRLFQSLMLSQIRFKEKVNQSAYTTKNTKRLPLLSMELSKFRKQQINTQPRDTDNLKINIRSSIQDQKIKQNNRIDNNSSQFTCHSSQTNIFIPAQIHQNKQNIFEQQFHQQNNEVFGLHYKKQVYPVSTSIQASRIHDNKILDESIISKPSFLTLQNITNQGNSFDKSENQQKFIILDYIFAEDTKFDKQNKETQRNRNIFIDMKKKIRKISKLQRNSYGQKELHLKSFRSCKNQQLDDKKSQLIKIHNQMLKKVYSDTQIIIDGCIFRNKTVPQRIDNDVDTDDEQINTGIRRLHKSLSQVASQYTSNTQKNNMSSFEPEQNMQDYCKQSKSK